MKKFSLAGNELTEKRWGRLLNDLDSALSVEKCATS